MTEYSPNQTQLQAIKSTSPLTVVSAGPGTGKTFTLTQRIISLIKDRQIPPQTILAVTFTRKATEEMRERINTALIEHDPKPTICTLHALGLKILSDIYKTDLRVIDANEQYDILTTLCSKSENNISPKETIKAISLIKNDSQEKQIDQVMSGLFNTYEKHLTKHDLVDYDDLINKPINLLQSNQHLKKKIHNRYRYIHVDEFQDFTKKQQTLLNELFDAQQTELFVIGDPNQSIYGFRGAQANGFDHLTSLYKDCSQHTLIQNYRSGATILNSAYAILEQENQLIAPFKHPGEVMVNNMPNERIEARHVVEMLQQLVGGVTRQNFDNDLVESHMQANYNLGDIAVLFRNRSQFQPFKRYLLRSGLPYQFVTNTHFLSDEKVNGYLEELQNYVPNSNESFQNIALLLLEQSEVPSEYQKILKFELNEIESGDLQRDRQLFFQHLKIMTFDNQLEIPVDRITFSTIHGSKGLEFPVVFVVGVEDGLLPHYWSKDDLTQDQINEERRLLFVAMTRAEERLIITFAHHRTVYGKKQKREPSRFISLLSGKDILQQSITPKRKKNYQRKLL